MLCHISFMMKILHCLNDMVYSSEEEMRSRYEILMEEYVKTIAHRSSNDGRIWHKKRSCLQQVHRSKHGADTVCMQTPGKCYLSITTYEEESGCPMRATLSSIRRLKATGEIRRCSLKHAEEMKITKK